MTDRETEIAKECLARDDRRRALLALRRKKYQESLLAKTDGQLAQLEQLTGQVEFALVQKDVVFGLQQGTQVLQAINKEMGGIEGVERLMGETEEARAYQEVCRDRHILSISGIMSFGSGFADNWLQEVSQMLAGHLTNQDEDEVEDELESLQREVSGPEVLPDPVVLPSPPTADLPVEESVPESNPKAKAKAETRTALPA